MLNITSSGDLTNKKEDITVSVSLQNPPKQADNLNEILDKNNSEKNSIKDISSVGPYNSFQENFEKNKSH